MLTVLAAVLDFKHLAPCRNESCSNVSGGLKIEVILHFTAVGHLGLDRKWIVKYPLFTASYNAPACQCHILR